MIESTVENRALAEGRFEPPTFGLAFGCPLQPGGTIPKSLTPGFEHPNKEDCRVWAEAIEPKVAELLSEAAIKP